MSIPSGERFANSRAIQQRLAQAPNYNAWLFSYARRYLGARVLEIGCALGNFTVKMLDGEAVCAIDIEEEYVASVRESFRGYANFTAVRYDVASADTSALGGRVFDTAICFNVLEHIPDDAKALRNIAELLVEGGTLCLIVPAFAALFGEMDRTDGHCRRYGRKELLRKVRDAGFTVKEARYLNLPGFFGWWFNGRILKKKLIPFRQMKAYDRVIPFVRRIENVVPVPFGQSIFLAAIKGGPSGA